MKVHKAILFKVIVAAIAIGGCYLLMPYIAAIALPIETKQVPVKEDAALSAQRLWIVTGGQTGVDRAALDTALSLGLPVRGWCPKGRLAEDGTIPPIYPLQETPSTEYAVRTEWNVRDSDATLILSYGTLEGGTKLTAELARKYNRPVLILNALTFTNSDIARFYKWIEKNHIRILNIAGPRESAQPGIIYTRASSVLKQILPHPIPKAVPKG
jgi:hypothetical protein